MQEGITSLSKEKRLRKLSILVLSEASYTDAHGEIGCILDLLIGDRKKYSVHYFALWMSHKSRSSVKSDPTADFVVVQKVSI